MYDNPALPEREFEPEIETEVLSGEIAGEPEIATYRGKTEVLFSLLVQHPSHEISALIPIACRGETVRRVIHLRRGSRVTVAGIRAFDEDHEPDEFVLCEYLKILSVAPDPDTE